MSSFKDLKLQTGYYNVHGHALDVSQPRALSKGLVYTYAQVVAGKKIEDNWVAKLSAATLWQGVTVPVSWTNLQNGSLSLYMYVYHIHYRAKNEEWHDLQLVSQITVVSPWFDLRNVSIPFLTKTFCNSEMLWEFRFKTWSILSKISRTTWNKTTALLSQIFSTFKQSKVWRASS